MPFFAIVSKRGRIDVLKGTWEEVKGKILGRSGVRYKKFDTAQAARDWAEETSCIPLQKKKPPSDISKGDAMRAVINTPFWRGNP